MRKIALALLAVSLTACQSNSSTNRQTQVLTQSVGMNVSRAYDYYVQNKHEEALALAKSIKPKTDYDRAYMAKLIGSMYYGSKDPTQAIPYFKKALSFNLLKGRTHTDLLQKLGELLIDKDPKTAETYLNEAARLSGKPKLDIASLRSIKHETLAKDKKFDAIALVRVEPYYPMEAARNGIEGYVEMSFTIDTTGSVTDIVVVKSVPKGVFDKAAIKSLSRWKYRPQIKSGKTIKTTAQTMRLDFSLGH